MSTIPPVMGIVNLKFSQEPGPTLEDCQQRVSQIFEGLMQANTDYLSIGFYELGNENTGMARVERQFSDSGYLRAVAASSLKNLDDPKISERIAKLFPGEVWLDLVAGGAANGVVRLNAYIPVYHPETGNLYGFAVLDSDFTSLMMSVLRGVELQQAQGYVTSAEGHIWVEANSREVHEQLIPKNVNEVLPELQGFFTNPQLTQDSNQSSGYTALRVRLDRANPETTVGIVLSLKDTRP